MAKDDNKFDARALAPLFLVVRCSRRQQFKDTIQKLQLLDRRLHDQISPAWLLDDHFRQCGTAAMLAKYVE